MSSQLTSAQTAPEPDSTATLWEANSDGTSSTRLAPDSGLASFGRPRFSPDGRYVVVGAATSGTLSRASSAPLMLVSLTSSSSSRAASYAVTTNGLPEDVWLIDMQSGGARRLADLALDSPSSAWSSDGRRIFTLGDRGLYRDRSGRPCLSAHRRGHVSRTARLAVSEVVDTIQVG